MAGGECTAAGVRPTRKSEFGEKSREPTGSLQLFADELAVFPDDQGKAEAFVFGAEFFVGAAMGTEGTFGKFWKFRFAEVGQFAVSGRNHFSS